MLGIVSHLVSRFDFVGAPLGFSFLFLALVAVARLWVVARLLGCGWLPVCGVLPSCGWLPACRLPACGWLSGAGWRILGWKRWSPENAENP